MTKLKNTKKGMAKKALSISLVAAMLATSNVPVWAAEFTDGTDAVVEAPVVEEAVDTFSAEAEAPVVEENTDEVATYAATDATYGYTASIKLKEAGNGWKDGIVLAEPMTVKDAEGNAVAADKCKWTVRKDGVSMDWGKDVSGYVPDVFKITTNHDDFGAQYDVYFEVTLDNGEKIGFTSNTVTVSAVDINKAAPGAKLEFNQDNNARKYTGKEIKLLPTNKNVINNGDGWIIPSSAMLLTYTGDTINYTDKNVVVTGVVKKAGTNEADPAYTGYVTGTYKIVKRDLSANNITGKLINPDLVFEYEEDLAEFATSDLELKINSSALTDEAKDITYAIKSAIAAGKTGKANGEQDVVVTLDTSKLTNFNWSGTNKVTLSNQFKIAKRDLSKVTATVKRAYSVTELRNLTLTPADIKFTDANGKTIKLDDGVTVSLDESVIKKATSGAGTYKAAVVVTGNTAYCENGPIKADLEIVNKGLANGTFTGDTYAKDAEKFAGENVAVVKDRKKLGDFKVANEVLTEGTDYTIEYANNTNASTKESGKAKLIVKGAGSYAGTQAEFEFTIEQAPVKEVKADKKELVYNPEYTSVADYLKDLKLTVNAYNESTDKVSTDVFALKDTEYTITNLKDLKATENNLDASGKIEFTVSVEATKDAEGNYSGNYKGTATTETITICEKSLSSEDVKVTVKPDSYVYTGSQIIPTEVIVTDGDVVLEEGTDYEIVTKIQSNEAVNVGTATVTVVAPAGSDYKEGSKATGTFTITPAKIEDVKVTYADAEYNGSKHADVNKVTLALGKIDVTKDFNITFPKSKDANINAGKESGKVILTAKSDKAKNYTSKTKEVSFEIKPTELSGSLKIYDEAGRELNQNQLDSAFDYDGTTHTFGKEKFTGTVSAPKKVTANDYEIIYRDNVYGKMYSDGSQYGNPYGVVLAVAKGNYKSTEYTSSNGLVKNGVYTDANGNKVENVVDVKWFRIDQATIAAKDITVNNGVYAGGYTVKPEVVVKVNGKTLAEGKDYELDLTGNKNLVDVTTAKTLTVKVKPINGYKMADAEAKYTFNWGIDKFDFANAEILVSGTDAEPFVKVMNGSVLVDPADYDLTVADGKVTVAAKADSKNYTGTKTVDIKHELEKPEKPMITDVKVVGNKATVVLSGDVEGADGYDYVISPNRNCIVDKDYTKVNKNVLTTQTTFTYTQQDTYYAYCHAWKKVNGKKVFGEWSNAYPFSVSSITPEQPVITSVKVSKNTVKVTYTKSKDATGYDLVLGKSMKKVNGEMRPVEYGKLVKKVYNGNTVTATFTKVPKGTYYVGLHAYNRTSEDGKKVFSPWSNAKKVVVK